MIPRCFVLMSGLSAFLLLPVTVIPASAQSGPDAEFGRFFTMPRTRAELNKARENYTLDRPPPRVSREEEPRIPQHIKLNGLILRSDGSGEVWINDTARAENGGKVDSASIEAPNQGWPHVTIRIPGGDRVRLLPGETLSLESGRIRDSFQHEGGKPEEPVEISETAELQQDKTETASAEDVEAFDESELADRDFRIRLLEQRLEKLESSINTRGDSESAEAGSRSSE